MQSTIPGPQTFKISPFDSEFLLKRFPEGIVSIDLETTGLSPIVDKIVEIGAIKITPSGVFQFETLINPEIPIPLHTMAIHQITDEMVKKSPKISDVLNELKNFIGDLPIIAHNARFDLGFLVFFWKKHLHPLGRSDIYCSCKLARSTHRELPNHKLKTLAAYHNIDLTNHHRALDDAKAAMLIFIESVKRAQDFSTLKKYGKLYELPDFEKNPLENVPAHLKPLEDLVQRSAIIEIKYNGGTVKNVFRPVKLSGLINMPEGNILYAKCLLTNEYKSFKLNKITALQNPTAMQISQWLQNEKFK